MNPSISFLVFICYGERLVRFAIQFPDMNALPDGLMEYPMEYKDLFMRALPSHVSDMGPIVDVQRIDGVGII